MRPTEELRRGFQGEADPKHFDIFTNDDVAYDHLGVEGCDHEWKEQQSLTHN